jgi:suppressor for copper-sensitivity B
MFRKMFIRFLRLARDIALAAPLTAGVMPAYADDAKLSLESDPVSSAYAVTRLISAQTAVGPGQGEVLLGFEVDLKPGWKTYWRSPGEAGVPPQWHWGKDTNVAAVTVHWPLPKRSSLFGIETVVYERQVVFPITVKLVHPGKPVSLDVTVDYFVCESICVPLQGHYKLDIPATNVAARPTRDAILIADFKNRVPRLAEGAASDMVGGMKITDAYLEKDGRTALLRVNVAGISSMTKADLFVEGPDSLGFGAASRSPGKLATLATFDVPVYSDGQNVSALLAKSHLTLTLTDGAGNAAEYRVKVQ